MGYICADYMTPASKHLLNLLKEKGTIHYGGTYYDISDERLEKIRKEMGFTEDDPEDTSYPPILIDFVVGQLERKGLVITEQLDEEMSDGEPDYTITLTEAGRGFVESGQAFKHWDMDL